MSQAPEMNIIFADADGSDNLSTNGILIAARNCDLGGDENFAYNTGKRGTRQPYSCGARKTREIVGGGFDCFPTEVHLDWLIQRMMGDNKSVFPASPATPGETPVTFAGVIDKGYDNFKYTKLCIADLSLTLPEGDLVSARVNMVGSKETSGATWPTLGTPPTLDCGDCCAVADSVLTVAGTDYSFKNAQLSISNNIPDIIENSMWRLRFEYGELDVNLNVTLAYRSDTAAMYRRGVAGDAVSLKFNTGSKLYTFTMANVKAPGQKIQVPDSGEITMNFAGKVFRTSGSNALSIAKENYP